jgi:sugar phosphate isomerase/epimerase/pimeloyl-ACP methyl ester carboxylesterase
VTKEERRLRVGVLGCGPVAQAAHLESCAKARNADLHAICDAAPDLVERMAWTHRPARTYLDYDAMLADPDVEAVIVATADAFHVPASIRALEAGKHVLCEKPLATSVEEAERLRDAVRRTGLVLQVGHMRRFDPGVEAAADFARGEMGGLVALKAWYGDSTHRYTMTDALQPLRVTSAAARRPAEDPRADLARYYMLAHGSHLVDTARYLAGEIVEVEARHVLRFGARCWFVGTSFASGRARPPRPHDRGPDGLARGLPPLRRARQRRRALLQPLVLPLQRGRGVQRGGRDLPPASGRGRAFLPAAARGVRRHGAARETHAGRRRRGRGRVRPGDGRDRALGRRRGQARPAGRRRGGGMTGRPIGIFARTFPGTEPGAVLAAARDAGYDCVQLNLSSAGLPAMPDAVPPEVEGRVVAAARTASVAITALSGTYNMIHPDPAERVRGLRRLGVVLRTAARIGAPMVTLCTGTRDPDDMWRAHPDNGTDEVWRDLIEAMTAAAGLAEAAGVDLGVEPETANVVGSAGAARRLVDEVRSPRVRVVLDPANLAEHADRAASRDLVAGAVDLLADRISLVHAKDRRADGSVAAPGGGVVDFADLAARLSAIGYTGPVVAHGFGPEEAPAVAASCAASSGEPSASRPRRRTLRVRDTGGGGPAVLFQHGLGGDEAQVAEVFPDGDGSFRRITVECRAHGGSTPGPAGGLSIATFADDALAACDRLGVGRFVAGGISMGAAVALRLAVRHPGRVRALILARPAWLFAAAPGNMRPFAEVAALLRRLPPAEAREAFAASPTAEFLASAAPDNLASLLGFFDRARPGVTADLLAAIAADGPGVRADEAAALRVPTLVIGHAADAVHPLADAAALAAAIPGAWLAEVTPKAADRAAHAADVRRAISAFLDEVGP